MRWLCLIALFGCGESSSDHPPVVEPEPIPEPEPLDRRPRPIDLGTCVPLAGPGVGCRGNFECRRGLTCIEDRCRFPGERGETCDGAGDCRAGLHCPQYDVQGTRLAERTCQPRADAAQLCWHQNVSTCVAGLVCVAGACAPPSDVGGPCWSLADCVQPGLFCADAGVCDRSDRVAGDACTWAECGPGLSCRDGRCAESIAPVLDGPCDLRCGAETYCDGFDDATGAPRPDGICRPRGAVGEPCQDEEYETCLRSTCVQGRCVADLAEGATCDVGACADGLRCVID